MSGDHRGNHCCRHNHCRNCRNHYGRRYNNNDNNHHHHNNNSYNYHDSVADVQCDHWSAV